MKIIVRSIAASVTLFVALTATTAMAAVHEEGELVDYPLVFPVDGDHYFSDWFWAARSSGIHHAQDIMADKMVPVVAAADGTVRLVNWTSQSHMNPERCCTIALRHSDGWESWYIHLNNDTPGTDDGEAWGIAHGIVPGVRVKAGQLIGWVGDSQSAEYTEPHLHFELRDPQGVIVNPFQALAVAGGNYLGWGPADPLFDGYRLLRVGVRGADVRRLQKVLTDLGYRPGPVDGISGSRTVAAVAAFQADAGLKTDGLAGRVTRAALKTRYDVESSSSVAESGILRKGSRGADVQRVQELLAKAGYSPGPADGIFGSRTELAVLSFQEDHGLRVDGLVGANTRKTLGF
jgi:peptidoglycan hydrolase-like protein with peptidoglycan-binding domain